VAVSAPRDSATLVPPIQILPLAALEARDRLASAYMVPQVAHAPGYAGAFWRTDLVVINPQKHPLRVAAQFLPTGADNRVAAFVADTLAPGQILHVPDILTLPSFKALGKLGAMLVYAVDPTGGCTGDRCNFLVLARTYNSSASPGSWRAVEWRSGVAPAEAVRDGDKAFFTQVSNRGGVRTSVGLASWSAEAVQVRVRLLAPGGRILESRDVELPPFGHLHLPLEAGVFNGRVEVELQGATQDAMIVPYISMVEEASGLPAHLLAERVPGPMAPKKGPPPKPVPLPSG